LTGRAVSATCDVLVVGDGPSGAAIAAACADAGLDTIVVGPGRPWRNTYGAWVDELADLPAETWAARTDEVITGGRDLRRIARPYGVLDNEGLRTHLRLDERRVPNLVTDLDDRGDAVVVEIDGHHTSRARWVVDARGATDAEPPAWQTAYGVVVAAADVRQVATDDASTLMDWSWSGAAAVPSFLYVVPVDDGWLVEHTVLAAAHAVDPLSLRAALVERLGQATVEAAEGMGRSEQVVIPMGVPPDSGTGRVVRFGARAGMAHPATGYSVAASLRAAPRVARAIAGDADVHAAVWSRSALRARALHDYGLAALLGFDATETAAFFSAFFALPIEQWAAYTRIDTSPTTVAAVMARLFRNVPWSVRRRLVRGDWRALGRAVGR
jgi:lycopene beta-cyclase